MDKFVLRLDKAKKAIDEADYILIGAGAGLSTAAGIEYTGERFERYFKDFIEKYDFTDMYSSGFYPFKTSEEKWAYWALHVFANRYDVGKTDVYQKLLKLVEDTDYFVLTTNVLQLRAIMGYFNVKKHAIISYIRIKNRFSNGWIKLKSLRYLLNWFRNVRFAVGKWI